MQMNQERVDELVPRKETVVKQKLIDKINALGADSSTTAKDLTYLSKSLEVLNKKVKAANFNIDTINQKTYIFGIAHNEDEKKEIIQEAKQIVDLKELVTSILMVSDLSRQRE